ncbi:MAG: Ig-like domain-containing protein [Bacteroidota bacterium]
MKKFTTLLFILVLKFSIAQQVCPIETVYPFTVDSVHLKIWNKTEYIPFFVKGSNLGVSVPGRHPGELAVTRAQYGRWFSLIKEAGFNSIRLYTLHYPAFYQVLDSFNLANPQSPLYFFQGVWMEEELPGYNQDLHFLDTSFYHETEENIDCVHGNRIIAPRLGKAHGTFTADVSKWNMGYIIGRETYPGEVLTTNLTHPGDTVFNGIHFSIAGNPSEVFITKHLDYLVHYEHTHYQTQRPVSFSSWPSLDPLRHFEEPNREEDTVSVDLNNIDFTNAPAGYFASYHAYPYYPDFIGAESSYQAFSDLYGPNSYLGYITRLKNHYTRVPLIVAETSVPSSWGVAHYTSNGMNHGGFDQQEQGETVLRLFHNLEDSGCGGGIHFSFMDEWFKRTWITDPVDYDPDRRILWHNVMGAEQNYGLIGFQRPLQMQNWESFNQTLPITSIKAGVDYDFFHLGLSLSEQMQNPDDLWISFDTYDASLGESILPTGDTVQNRAEFALHITNYSAELYVTQAYDIFGIWHHTSAPSQLYHSIPTDGAPWVVERWKNNVANNQVQYVGNLKVNSSFLPASSMDAVTIYPDSVHIRLPWSLLHFVDPSTLTVLNDLRSTPTPEDTVSDGIQVAAFFHNQRAEPVSRFTWDTWNVPSDIEEYKKTSYYVVKEGLTDFNNGAIAVSDSYVALDSFPYQVPANNGLLSNDFDLDGTSFQALIIDNATHGTVNLNADGSFTYTAEESYVGDDYFEYCIFDGFSLSKSAYVCLEVNNVLNVEENGLSNAINVTIFPNPASDVVNVKANKTISNVALFSSEGKLMKSLVVNDSDVTINTTELSRGIYYLKTTVGTKMVLNRISVVR